VLRQKDDGEREDQKQPGEDETESTEESANLPAESPRTVDRELGGGWTGKQIGRRDCVFEIVLVEPVALINTKSS
jgi:hypothetical protein